MMDLTARERIYQRMLLWAYTRARELGMTAVEATEEAFQVAEFVKRLAA
jgi:hypothetical protein